jgi:hypothetical protein
MTFEANKSERLRIFTDGRVSIGSTSADGRLAIFDYADGGRALTLFHLATIEATATQPLVIADVQATNDWGIYQAGATDTNYFSGDVTIGTTTPQAGAKLHVTGNIYATGSITGASVVCATYQDLAEWVPASSDLTPGTVVVLNTDRTNEVMSSTREYDTTVAGVVSAQPGIILGTAGDTQEQIATTGRVKVRVDASFGPIRVGDLLVTSNVPGTAMRSEPVDVAGRKMHQPGTIIGKALEPLASGSGEILVLLSLQ